MRQHRFVFGLLFVSLLWGCNNFFEVEDYWSGKNGTKIYFDWKIGDFGVYYQAADKTYYLFAVAYSDSNERVQKFAISEDESKVGFLIHNSTDRTKPNGTLFIVFDLNSIAEQQIDPVIAVLNETVIDFSISDTGFEYILEDQSKVMMEF